MSNNIDEGLFKADRKEVKLFDETKEGLQKKISQYQAKYKDHQPKISNIKADGSGRFYVTFSFLENEEKNKEDIFSKIGRGISKGKEVVKKGVEVGKKIAASMPRQGSLSSESNFDLSRKMASFTKDHPDVKYGKKFKNDKGEWEVRYSALNKKSEPKNDTQKDTINNIQKAINKLSDDEKKQLKI